MAHFLGIDVGTSFLKGAVLEADPPKIRHVIRREMPEFLSGRPAGWHEADAGEVADRGEALLAELAAEAPGYKAVLLCGQMHSVVLTGSAGEPLAPFISWLDQRVPAEEFAALGRLVPDDWRRELGGEFRSSIGVSFLWWLRRQGALPAGATPCSLPDFVAARLCRSVPVAEPTHAAALGSLRLAGGQWHRELIGALGLDALHWPEVRPSGSVVGHWRGVPVYTAVGDQQCALAGALLEPGELSVNIGTGSQVACLADAPDAGPFQVRPYFGGRFLRTITHIPGGRALSALLGLLTELAPRPEAEAWDAIERAVAAVPATDLRASLSFYPGPCGERGALENLREGNLTAGHVFRAAFECMARNYAGCASRLGGGWRRAVFSGGVARRLPLLRALTAEALGVPPRLSPHPEDTLYGLLVLGRAWAGSGSTR